MQHFPVLLAESLEYLAIEPAGTYVDATTGLGGHTGAIAARLSTGVVFAADRDPESIEISKRNTAAHAERIRYVHSRFSGLQKALQAAGAVPADGLLADLGVSRYQLTEPGRGFSLMSAGPVDMRMDRSSGEPAGELLNYAAERELADLIFQLGEERRSRRIARAIVRARPIRDTLHLAEVIESAVPRSGAIHPATRTFMALRIAVNEEQAELDALLAAAPEIVKPGGRFVVLTFMSTEDRAVKQAFQRMARDGRANILTRHVVPPSDEEVRSNPPSRSAKLRAVEMK
ncbi:MAG TPA: 16S rRNA (cytosine(1402)-N(4))-methyltransferase RsmH [Bryobacteraceae bacterium]|nr:16S rRNA (cytosine(1402)-N(4))-methyltransferase RsmH [Bryobacteraceae bacterium]